MSSCKLKQFLIDVLDGRNSFINKVSKDLDLKEQLKMLVNDLSLTEHSFQPKLDTIVTLLLSNSMSNGCWVSLLLFSMELDSYHSLNSPWYRRQMLIETLYNNKLLNSKFSKEEEYSFWVYVVIIILIYSFLVIALKTL